MPVPMADIHLLQQLVLPARYEVLRRHLGAEVVQLLVEPGAATVVQFERLAQACMNRGEGAFVPLIGTPGTGKTTLAENFSAFVPSAYAPTLTHTGDVTTAQLEHTVEIGLGQRRERRLIPINIDHRETVPASDTELAEIKRFLRGRVGSRTIIVWPETTESVATAMAERWAALAGASPIPVPVVVQGPPRETWIQTAINTLRLCNSMIENLEELGVDPRNYNPEDYPSIGEFLRQVADDFTDLVHSLVRLTRTPLPLCVLVASGSPDQGILSELTVGGRFGFVDGNAALEATRNSKIGRWWSEHRGLLTQAIVRLDVRVMCLPPTVTVSALRHYGPEEVQTALDKVGIRRPGDARLVRDLSRTDFGRFLLGESRAASETRGRPSPQAEAAFDLTAETFGFGSARDKQLNQAISASLRVFLERNGIAFESVSTETGLPDLQLIPDMSIRQEHLCVCIEPTWRRGTFLTSAHRGDVANYILTKLHNYCETLGWLGT